MTTDERAGYDCSICLGVGLTVSTLVAGIAGLLLAKIIPDVLALLILSGGLLVANWAVLRYCAAEYPSAGIVVPEMPTSFSAAPKAEPEAPQTAKPAAAQTIVDDEPGDHGGPDYDGDGVDEGADEGTRPSSLIVPMAGGADDLKQIKGVGPRLETMLKGMGYFHYEQIANWSADEVAWIDANLIGFKGRVSRDNWVEQARVLADTGPAE